MISVSIAWYSDGNAKILFIFYSKENWISIRKIKKQMSLKTF